MPTLWGHLRSRKKSAAVGVQPTTQLPGSAGANCRCRATGRSAAGAPARPAAFFHTLIAELEGLGWSRVSGLNDDLSSFTLALQDSRGGFGVWGWGGPMVRRMLYTSHAVHACQTIA